MVDPVLLAPLIDTMMNIIELCHQEEIILLKVTTNLQIPLPCTVIMTMGAVNNILRQIPTILITGPVLKLKGTMYLLTEVITPKDTTHRDSIRLDLGILPDLFHNLWLLLVPIFTRLVTTAPRTTKRVDLLVIIRVVTGLHRLPKIFLEVTVTLNIPVTSSLH